MSEVSPAQTALSEWYKCERERMSSLSRRAAAAVWASICVCVAQVLFTAVTLHSLVSDYGRSGYGRSDHSIAVAILLWAIAKAVVAVFVWVQARVGVADVRALVPAKANEIPEIVDIVEQLSDKMGMAVPDISYWVSNQPGSASVVEVGSRTRLLLSVNVLIDVKRCASAVRGLLAHELAHIRHQDTHVWSIVTKIAVPLRTVLAVMILISLGLAVVVNILTSGWPWNWDTYLITPSGAIPYGVVILLSYAVKLHQRAEVLADCAGVLATGSEDVRAALMRYVAKEEFDVEHEEQEQAANPSDERHPTRRSRLKRIEQFEVMAACPHPSH